MVEGEGRRVDKKGGKVKKAVKSRDGVEEREEEVNSTIQAKKIAGLVHTAAVF